MNETECLVCEHVEQRGMYPPRVPAHCGTCHRSWTGHTQAHCASCCVHFSSDRAFDRHLAPPKANADCFDPASLTKSDGSPLFKIVEHVSGPVWTINTPHGRFPARPEQPGAANTVGVEE